MSQLQAWVRRALWDVVPRDHQQSGRELRRRQLVTVGVVVLGAVVLGVSLRLDPGSRWFYAVDSRAGRGVDRRRVRLRPAAPRPDPGPAGDIAGRW